MFGRLKRQADQYAERIAKIQWAAKAVTTPGSELEHPDLRTLREMPRRIKAGDDREMAAIVSHLHQSRKRQPPQPTRRDRFDGVTIDITPNP